MESIHVYILGTQGLPAQYGGFETLVDSLTRMKQSEFIEYTVVCQRPKTNTKIKRYNNAKLVYLPLMANGVQSILFDMSGLVLAAIRGDVALLLGTSGATLLPVLRMLRPRLRVITNMAGLEWSRSKWGRLGKLFLRISEFCAVRFSTTLIADNKKLVDYVFDKYSRDAVFIPYGGDSQPRNVNPRSITNTPPVDISDDYFVMVARCQPDNNFEMILDAFSNSNQRIIVVSNFDGSSYSEFVKRNYRDQRNITLTGPIYDQKKLSTIRRNAICYVHGHSAGGTNPALVEALWLGSPILAFSNVFNEETALDAAQYFSDEKELTSLIADHKFIAGSNSRGLALARSRYRWCDVVSAYEKELLSD